MNVIIPVAGTGSRLRPLTHTVAKPLLEAAGRPILAYILDPLKELDIDQTIFVIGHKGEQVRDYVNQNYCFNAQFVRQHELLGLGYAVNLALESADDREILIILGDTIAECDLGAFVEAGRNVLGVKAVDDPERFGIAEKSAGKITRLVEKPTDPSSNLALIGLYYFTDTAVLRDKLAAHVANGVQTSGEIQLTDALQAMIEDGYEFTPYEVDGWHDCGKKETLLATNRYFLDKTGNNAVFEGTSVVPPTFIHPTAKVTGSTVGPHVSVSEGAVVEDSEISNAIIGPGATIRGAIVRDRIVGRDAMIEGNLEALLVGDEAINCL